MQPHDVRRHYRKALDHAKHAQVTIMPELKRHVGSVEPELHFPELTLQDISFAPHDPTQIRIPRMFTQVVHTWKHTTLVQLLYQDRLYQSSDSDLAQPRDSLRRTIERSGIILGSDVTPNHDRPFLLALYAATIGLEVEMRQDHPRYVAAIAGSHRVNRSRMQVYADALDFFKTHIENLLRVSMEHHV
jgi:hypothetical protein